jgi:predicted HNH restriction endonuclease
MLIFISQLSFLEWTGKKLILDVMSHEKSDVFELVFAIQPYIHSQKVDRCEEFKVITNFEDWHENDYIIPTRDMNVDYQFTEGKRVRVSHLRIERSPSLRRRFFENYPDKICDMCSLDSDFKYPWVDNILELHHILPLSSSIRVESYGTLLEDIRPLCPSCHRGTHIYYRKWLEEKELYDFRNKKEAWDIYTEAKEQVK